MESLEGLCFTHLCSYLFFNELLILRLVSTSIKRELEGKEFAFNVGQAGARIFPSHWSDTLPRGPSNSFHASAVTKDARIEALIESDQGIYREKLHRFFTRNDLSLYDNGEELSSTPCTRVIVNVTGHHRPPFRQRSKEGEEWSSRMFFCRYLSIQCIREGLRELCLCWQETDQPRRLSFALRELLKVCAPSLESLVCSGSCLAVWRYSFPLELNFPSLNRLLVITSFRNSELSVRQYREHLTWHVLRRCQFPACLEFRWMDFFSENYLETFSEQVAEDVGETTFQVDDEADEAEDKDFHWHEINLQQVDCLITFLSSMKCLRDFTFSADSRYSIVQILLYLAAQQEETSISTVEIVPAYPNFRTLERDWLLSPLADTGILNDTPDAISSVKTLRLVLRDCKLEDIHGADILPVLQRLCPYANICVTGSVRTSFEAVDEAVRNIPPQATDTKPVLPYPMFAADIVDAESNRESYLPVLNASAPDKDHNSIVDAPRNAGSVNDDRLGPCNSTSNFFAHRDICSGEWLIESFCTAPLEIFISIPEKETSVFGRSGASVKFVRLTGVGREDESACVCMSQAVKELLHLRNSVLPAIRFGPVASCTRRNTDRIERLVAHFPHIILSVEGYGADPECFIHQLPKLSKTFFSSPAFFEATPCSSPSAIRHSSSPAPRLFPMPLKSSTRKDIEVVGLQINLTDGALSSDVCTVLKILNKHPDVSFLRFVDTWSPAAFRKPMYYVEHRLLTVFLRHNKCQVKSFEYTCVGPACWQREAGQYACGPDLPPDVVGKEFFLHKKVAFLAAGGVYGSGASDAVQRLFSSLYVRGSNPRP